MGCSERLPSVVLSILACGFFLVAASLGIASITGPWLETTDTKNVDALTLYGNISLTEGCVGLGATEPLCWNKTHACEDVPLVSFVGPESTICKQLTAGTKTFGMYIAAETLFLVSIVLVAVSLCCCRSFLRFIVPIPVLVAVILTIAGFVTVNNQLKDTLDAGGLYQYFNQTEKPTLQIVTIVLSLIGTLCAFVGVFTNK